MPERNAGGPGAPNGGVGRAASAGSARGNAGWAASAGGAEGNAGGTDADAAAVARVLAGDKEAFRFLARKYERELFALGLSFLRDREASEDFVQEVLLKTWRSLGRFEGRSRFSTWLYRIAYNTGLNAASRGKTFLSLAESEETAGRDLTPEEQAVKNAVKAAVREATFELPERYRVCVDLFFFYDRTFKEIEAITGFPENTVKSHVFRAKKLLKAALADFGGFE